MSVDPVAAARSPRNIAMLTLKNLWKTVNSGKYFVKRGAINWVNFNFEKWPFAVAILIDQCSLLRVNGINEAHVSLEIFTRLDTQAEVTKQTEIDDDLMDGILYDVESVLVAFMKAIDPNNPEFKVAYKVVTETLKVVETHDTDLQVQGAIVQFLIAY